MLRRARMQCMHAPQTGGVLVVHVWATRAYGCYRRDSAVSSEFTQKSARRLLCEWLRRDLSEQGHTTASLCGDCFLMGEPSDWYRLPGGVLQTSPQPVQSTSAHQDNASKVMPCQEGSVTRQLPRALLKALGHLSWPTRASNLTMVR